MNNIPSYLFKRLALIGAVLACICLPQAATAQQSAHCTVNGQPGVYVSIAVNGQHCLPIGQTVNNNVLFTFFIAFVQFLSVGAGLLVTCGIIYGGYLYITARGNSGQTEKGRDVIVNSMIGLIMFIFMAAILNFLLGVNIFR